MSAIARFLTRRGENFTLTPFTEGAADAYGDTAITAGSTSTLRGLRVSQASTGAESATRESGVERLDDLDVIVAASAVVPDPAEDGVYPPHLEDAAGRIYVVHGIRFTGAPVGAKRLVCRRKVVNA